MTTSTLPSDGTIRHPPTLHGPTKSPSKLASCVGLLKRSAEAWNDDNASRLAAALACYTVLSIAPLVVLCVAIAGLAFGHEAAEGQIASELGSVVGREGAQAIQSIIASAKDPGSGILASVGGIAVLLLGASGVFGELQSALNTVWEVQTKPGRGLRGFIRDRFFSFTMVLGVGFLLLVSLIISAALAAVSKYLAAVLPLAALWQVLNHLLALGVTTFLFALMFKVIPDAVITWHDVWIGAFVTALLFSLGRVGLGLYIGRSGISSSYGAAGSIVALVVWIYYSAQILLFGAEFTQAYATRSGRRIEPTPNAISLVSATFDGAKSRSAEE